ncbi:uncharacterized protein LOC142317780 isoform X2 [Lycorma delicatula]|uniref:uncharacterized protein LOC142317780 isoform X2 n=1 Tax=Lycorma delicatula TaxID=130591 RepID=UPI003F516D66
MPARSPHRRSPVPVPPAPPRISRRSPPPPVKRGRSLDRRGGSSGPSRRREFRNGSPPHRRSRSPVRRGEPKGPPPRDFVDIPKRKLSPPPPKKSRREDGRRTIGSPEIKQTRSKSPLVRERGPRQFGDVPGGSGGYSGSLGPDSDSQGRLSRTIDSGDRFRGAVDYEEAAVLDRPIFRGPEGTVRFDPNVLKRISVEIVRRNLLPPETQVINRAIVNPEDITPVRRPEMSYGDQMNQQHGRLRDPSQHHPPPHPRSHQDNVRSPSPWWNHPSAMDDYNQRDSMGYPNRERASRIRSPGPSREPHGFPYPSERERERSPYDSRPHARDLESREKRSERYHGRGEDLRHELDQRRRDEPPTHYRPSEYRDSSGSYGRPRENESDLRARISEKRSEPHYRHDERERERDKERHEIERERHRPHRSPPPRPTPAPRDRRRGSPEIGPSRNIEREAREREAWDREQREREGPDRKRRGRSRERDDERRPGGGHRHSSVERFPDPERKEQSYSKPDYEYDRPNEKEFYERDEFSGSGRGRGSALMRRGIPHPSARGMPSRFRPPVMAMRAPPFIPFRGGFRPQIPRAFSPRIGFFPPPFRPFFIG